MQNKLYVGNIPYNLRSEDLQQICSEVAAVVEAKVILEKDTGRSKGFAFVEMETEEGAQKVIEKLNGGELMGRTLFISLAKPVGTRESSAPRRPFRK
ncbi:MAG TPA: RNA-binding protein [Alphaproteobacteria bacterium]|nr:RNA-binding protein [Alphaproteobacteria bacterium]